MSNKSYRVRYDFDNPMDHIKIDINQTFNTIDILSLKINQEGAYRLHTSNYGVLIGRVMANNGFGIPNAKVSLFIKNDGSDSTDTNIGVLYPYKSAAQTNYDGIKYNLLPNEANKKCHQPVGTFPSKRTLLDNDSMIEVFDKYYKYTTRTNQSGDYMLFGVPTGSQELHIDIDLSDIGVLSQAPRDFIYKGYNLKQFESPNKFKSGKDIGSLSQIISQDTSVFIYPFWGDDSYGDVAVSRRDFKIEYTFEPTCVFIGSIFTDSQKGYIGKSCRATSQSGRMSEITSSQGSIEMIRKKPDGGIEILEINGNRLIDDNGSWCYQIPMNLDYVITDESGNLVPTTEYGKGIPTRAEVRFRVNLDDTGGDSNQIKTASYLIPNNPLSIEDSDYNFNSYTKDGSFVNLMWNKVYSVKNYIPRVQGGVNVSNRKFIGLKSVNHSDSNNPAPYNNIWINLNLRFILNCLLVNMLTKAVGSLNVLISKLHETVGGLVGYTSFILLDTSLYGDDCPLLEGKEYYAPFNSSKVIDMYTGSDGLGRAIKDTAEAYDIPVIDVYNRVYFGNKTGKNDIKKVLDCSETSLSSDNEVINFDFFNDWLNGGLYAPKFQLKTKKDKDGKVKRVKYCGSKELYSNLKIVSSCSPKINESTLSLEEDKDCGTDKGDCYKQTASMRVLGGLIAKDIKNDIYYYRAGYSYSDNEVIKYAFLHATDVILLGSLSEKDLDGIPQLHQALPSTSFKLPPDSPESEVESIQTTVDVIGTPEFNHEVQDYLDMSSLTELNDGDICYVQNTNTYYEYNNSVWEQIQPQDYPVIGRKINIKNYTNLEMSGIDWGNDYNGGYNFKNGLFTSIKCLNSITTLKTCVNASRLCEIGVDFDERFEYNNEAGVYISKEVDGYISEDEISDSNSRSMFSSLNINKLQTYSNQYGHKKYKLKYNFPNSFDGRLKAYSESTNGGLDEDPKSDDYNLFRSSEIPYYYVNNKFKRFLNSFYFYFGIKNGKTSIDTFNSQYFAPCDDGVMGSEIASVSFFTETKDASSYNRNDGYVIIHGIGNNFDYQGLYSIKAYDSKGVVKFQDELTSDEHTITITPLAIGDYSIEVGAIYNGQLINGLKGIQIKSKAHTTTTDASNIASTGFKCGLTIVSDGNGSITESGLCYNKTGAPNIGDTKITNTNNNVTFSANINNLSMVTTYYVRSYVVNDLGIYYGNEITATTLFSNIVTDNVTISDDGKSATMYGYTPLETSGITELGFIYGNNNQLPYKITSENNGNEYFNSTITGLSIGIMYAYKAYVVYNGNTYTGDAKTFYATTNTPIVETNRVYIENSYVNYLCNVTNRGVSDVTDRGVIYSTILPPEIGQTGVIKVSKGVGTGQYNGLIPVMNNVEDFYFRAYAINSKGVSYGAAIKVEASSEIPTVSNKGVSEITKNSARVHGTITTTGGQQITSYGVYFSTSTNPTVDSEHVYKNESIYGEFNIDITGLTSNTAYHAFLYAQNGNGSGCSFIFTFRTLVEVSFKPYEYTNGHAFFNNFSILSTGAVYGVPYNSQIRIEAVPNEGYTASIIHNNISLGSQYNNVILGNMKNIDIEFNPLPSQYLKIKFLYYDEGLTTITFNDIPVSPAGRIFDTFEYGGTIFVRATYIADGYKVLLQVGEALINISNEPYYNETTISDMTFQAIVMPIQ